MPSFDFITVFRKRYGSRRRSKRDLLLYRANVRAPTSFAGRSLEDGQGLGEIQQWQWWYWLFCHELTLELLATSFSTVAFRNRPKVWWTERPPTILGWFGKVLPVLGPSCTSPLTILWCQLRLYRERVLLTDAQQLQLLLIHQSNQATKHNELTTELTVSVRWSWYNPFFNS